MDIRSDALSALERAITRSKRESTVRFPIAYVRRGDGEDPMVAQLLRGGQGGEVRLKVHLTLAMQATKRPYTLPRRPARSMARMLNLDEKNGSRRVTDALTWLEDRKLLTSTRRAPGDRELQLLDPTGSGEAWPAPSGRYLGIPLSLWSNGWILAMSGRSLAIYLALTERLGGSTSPSGELLDGPRKRQYGLSDDTWTRATQELERLGLLTATPELFGDDDLERRTRKRYLLNKPTSERAPRWRDVEL